MPILNLVGTCPSAMEAYARLAHEEIDLLICDIEMPQVTGLGLARSLAGGPLILFVTSHSHYALPSYEVAPVDFLLKPIDPERFMRSIERVRQRLLTDPESIPVAPYFFIRENHDYVQIPYHDVLYIRSQDHFLQVVTSQKTYLPMLPLSKMEEQLKGDVFLRVHRSYLVHRGAIQVITKNEIYLTNGDAIPIGDQYRAKISRLHVDGNLIRK
jgi:two-component system, LytTR family, response regulator LytT